MNLRDRAEMYNELFPDYPELRVSHGWLVGVWLIGNYYKNASKFYGAYPHSYLKRILSLFPDVTDEDILHLFSGSIQSTSITTFDIDYKTNPDVIGDAHNLATCFGSRKFKLILADPPYSQEDADHYGTPMINRNKVVKECVKVLEPNGFLVWLDQVYPMYRKTELKLVGTIGLVRSTNHRTRMVFIFQKVTT